LRSFENLKPSFVSSQTICNELLFSKQVYPVTQRAGA